MTGAAPATGAEQIALLSVLAMLSLLSVNFRGPDPSDALAVASFLIVVGTPSLRRYFGDLRAYALPALLFTASVAVSNLVTVPAPEQLAKLVVNVCGALAFFAVRRRRGSSAPFVTAIAVGLMACSSIAALSVAGAITLPQFLYDPGRDARFMGLMGDPNLFGLLSGGVAICSIGRGIARSERPLASIGWSVVGVLSIALCALTLSRSAWIASSAAGLILGGYAWRTGRIKPFIMRLTFAAVIVSGGFLTLLKTSPQFAEVWEQRVAVLGLRNDLLLDDPREQQRESFYYTRRAFDLAVDHPLGLGAGGLERNLTPINEQLIGAHNSVVQVLGDYGLLCFAVLMVLGSSMIWRATREFFVMHLSSASGDIGPAVPLAMLIAVVGVGMFQDLIGSLTPWVLISLAAAPPTRGASREKAQPRFSVGRMARSPH